MELQKRKNNKGYFDGSTLHIMNTDNHAQIHKTFWGLRYIIFLINLYFVNFKLNLRKFNFRGEGASAHGEFQF